MNKLENNTPLVSICCVTYNHEPYIKACLDSFLIQKCNFKYEILIHDDASTDNTQEIIKIYQEKYPEIIKPILQVENQRSKLGGGINPRFNYPRAQGKYIALCEGDDYWTDPLKLQKQVDFLESNPSYSFVSGNTIIKKNSKETPLTQNFNLIQFEDMLEGNKLGTNTCTLCFRKDSLPNDCLAIISKAPYGDWATTLLLLKQGNGHFLQDILGVYRLHDKGIWSSLGEAEKLNGIFKMYSYIETTYPNYSNKIKEYRINAIKKIQQTSYNRAMLDFNQNRNIVDFALFKLKLKEKIGILIKNVWHKQK